MSFEGDGVKLNFFNQRDVLVVNVYQNRIRGYEVLRDIRH